MLEKEVMFARDITIWPKVEYGHISVHFIQMAETNTQEILICSRTPVHLWLPSDRDSSRPSILHLALE